MGQLPPHRRHRRRLPHRPPGHRPPAPLRPRHPPVRPVRRRPAPGVELVTDLDELCARSTVVSVHAPQLPSTYRMIGAAQLAAMPDGATLINTARGSLIDEEALLPHLLAGRLHATLDVTDPDLPPPDSPSTPSRTSCSPRTWPAPWATNCTGWRTRRSRRSHGTRAVSRSRRRSGRQTSNARRSPRHRRSASARTRGTVPGSLRRTAGRTRSQGPRCSASATNSRAVTGSGWARARPA